MASLEYVGKIIKQENIDTVNENILQKTFVINVQNAYDSYYTRFTDVEKPDSIIFVTKTPNSFEKILRVTAGINRKYGLNLDGAKCEVKIGARKLNGIRVKGINRYPDIAQVQQYYKDEGYDFAKSEKFKNTDSLIRINRFFNIEKLAEGIFKSNVEDDVYYVTVPRYMTWDEFRTITFEIKNNMSDKNYDIAKGIVYIDGGIKEFLRIVKPKFTLESIQLIRDKYIQKLQE
ncbi:hypothetical protein SAMN06265371_104250 [Lutibacter agarilyticus]|uniref:Uncharacterized protein n=1 Tax=Lutibacter agarilyticus TaxID=1109740 RepID=A0A238X0D1_9FLAO|nr:hypothetical protein [Lutibacter agarilyticus]SNR52162.1 hypothetical protein SAMN06265371_104250 [Lutibacter agarilyticus]